ncbi:MAG: bifunctional copper resistance protein CopD/cytochrome c oxidase assembly protein [Actinobacteria bacterium]|nr:bifunctional copper resistance protein CopD/cytochrome c oxidase assembly protein [Actinomycetota bacterium]
MSTQTPSRSQASGAPRQPTTGKPLIRIVIGFGVLAIVTSLVGVVLSGASYVPAPAGLPDTGPVVTWLLPASSALVFAAAMATVGWLLLAGFLDPALGKKTVSARGRRSLLRASAAAAIWCLSALASAFLTLAYILGIPLTEAMSPNIFATYAWDVEDVRALLITAVLAAVVSIGSLLTVELRRVTIWLALALAAIATPATAGHAAGLGDHSLALTNSVVHAVTASIWVGGLIALGALVWPRAEDISIAAQRFGYLAIASVILLTLSGLGNAYVRLGAPSDLVTSGYGRLVLMKAALLIVLIAIASWIRQRLLPRLTGDGARRTFAKVAVLELGLMAVATGLGVALSLTEPTRVEIEFATQGEALLGFAFPPSPTATSVLFGWDFDILFFTLGVAACVFYVMGTRRLKARGDHWPVLRTVSWFVGWGIFIWTTNAGISIYSQVSVGLHMVQHMTIVMMVPIFLVLAGPVTLALRAIKPSPTGGRGPRELIMSGLHSKIAIFFTNPLIILGIYVSGLYGLYLTDLFGFLMSSHIGHIFMTVHFLVSGLLLYYVVVGIDPKPKPLPHWARMMLVLTAIVLHAFFAVALMSTPTVVGANWFSLVQPEWLVDPVKDSVLGGQVAWGVGEIPSVLLLLIIGVQWSRSDERESKRRDRFTDAHGDREMDDYNAYLAALNDRASRRR